MKNVVFWDKNSVRTSQETYFLSPTELSRLMLCQIWGFHGVEYEEYSILEYDSVLLLLEPTFRMKV
jgi:hypothetical protein